MALENNELLNLIGYTPEEGVEPSIDDIKKHVNSKFVLIDELPNRSDLIDPQINAKWGERIGKEETAMIKAAKEAGLDVTHGQYKDMSFDEIRTDIFSRFKEATAAKAQGGKKNEEYEAEIKKLRDEYAAMETAAKGYQTEFEAFKAQVESEKQMTVVGRAKSEAMGNIKWVANTLDVTKDGIMARFDNMYDIRIENDTPYVVHKSGENKGSRVQNPKDVTKFLTVSDALTDLVKEKGLWSDSPHENKTAQRQTPRQYQPRTEDNQKPRTIVSDRFMRQGTV